MHCGLSVTSIFVRIFTSIVLVGTTSFGASAQTAPGSPPGGAFYQPPQPLPAAPHGTLIRSLPLKDAAALPSAARNLLVLYHSRASDGRDIAVSGTIAIPPGKAPAGGWPVTTWTHGTTGIGPSCAPSRDTPTGPEHQFLAIHTNLMDTYVKRGYVVVATDYEGLGPPGLHPFLQGVSEGRGALDIVRAARAIDPHIGTRVVVVGHSQGGQADLFTAAIGPSYTPELKILGNVAMAPASHIGATVRAMVTAAKPSFQLGYAMYVLESFASNHPAIDLKKILTPQALAHLPVTRKKCITATVTTGYWARAIPKDQFLAHADVSAILAVAATNEASTLRITSPTLIVQGKTDDTVMPAWTDAVVRTLCAKGNDIRYTVYPDTTHETIVDHSKTEVAAWVKARFAGTPAKSNCNMLPTAVQARE
jgi:pimeloyl-ACP methyl ester carboxylesterase